MGDEGLEGVDRVTGAGTHLEVDVRAGDVAGGADPADGLTGADPLAGLWLGAPKAERTTARDR